MRENKIIKRKLCRFTILDFKYDLILSLYQDQCLPSDSWLVLPSPPTDPLAQTQNENCCKTYSLSSFLCFTAWNLVVGIAGVEKHTGEELTTAIPACLASLGFMHRM